MSTQAKPAAVALDIALMRGALDEVPIGVAITRGGEILSANAALERIYGAPPGGLDGRPIAGVLLDQGSYAAVRRELDERRVWDGRVVTRGLDGRSIQAELHAERYTSSQDGKGGFIVVRDVTFEAGALARLIDQLGGVLFRISVVDGRLEHVSDAAAGLFGLTPAECYDDPRAVISMVPVAERERVAVLYDRIVRGETATASVEITVWRRDGSTALVQVRATGRRDPTGRVRHIDGVATDVPHTAARAVTEPPPSSERAAPVDPLADVARALSHELGTVLHDVETQLGTLHAALAAGASPEVRDTTLGAAMAGVGAATVLERRIRRGLDVRASSGPLVGVLDAVRGGLARLVGEHAVSMSAGNAGAVVLARGTDQLTLALTYLGLRAFRLAGSGSLRIEASHLPPSDDEPRARRDIEIALVGEPPTGNTVGASDLGSGLMAAASRHADMLTAFGGAQRVVEALGGRIVADDQHAHAARTLVRLRA